MKNYFDFIMYLAFRTILIYENKRSLTVEQLHNYRKKLCEKHIQYHSQFSEYDDEEFEENLRFFHSSNMNMTLAEEGQNLINFINNNDEYFFYKDGVISLRDGVTYNDLEEANFKLDSYTDRDDRIICGELIGRFDCIECLDILGVTKIKEFVYKIIEDEKKIERAYQTYSGMELEQNIKKILELVNYRLALIGNLKDDKMQCYHRAINGYADVDLDDKGEDVWLLSDDLMKKDQFYNLNDKYIDYVLSNKFQRAIFDTGTLVYDRLYDSMSMMWNYLNQNAQMEIELLDPDTTLLSMEERMEELDSFEDEFEHDDVVTYFDEYDEENDMNQVELYLHDKKINMAFYLNYINHINKFSEKFGIDGALENSKNRLLYLLDSGGDHLYKDENFKKALSNVFIDDLDYKEDFNGFYMMSRLFLVDILEQWSNDDMTLRKMLFASTYYELTEDERIKRIIDKYKQTDIGIRVHDAIINHQIDKLIIGNEPYLVKKPITKNNPNK